MSKTNTRKPTLLIIAVAGHVFTVIVLWFLLRKENIQEPVFEKVISATLTTKPPSKSLPILDQATRDKVEKERRQKEESDWKKQQESLKKMYEAQARKKREAEAKKKAEAEAKKKKAEDNAKKKKIAEKQKKDKAESDRRKKELAAKKAAADKAAREKREREAAERRRKEKMLADQRAKAAAERAAAKKRQANLGRHVSAAISTRLSNEWNKGINSAIQFNDPNDFVTIKFTINRNGQLLSARVTKRAKSSNLNAKAAALIKIVSASGYRFPPFDPAYEQNSITIPFDFRIE